MPLAEAAVSTDQLGELCPPAQIGSFCVFGFLFSFSFSFFFGYRISLSNWLAWTLLCRSGWPLNSICLSLPPGCWDERPHLLAGTHI